MEFRLTYGDTSITLVVTIAGVPHPHTYSRDAEGLSEAYQLISQTCGYRAEVVYGDGTCATKTYVQE